MSVLPAHLLSNIFLWVQLRCVWQQPLDSDLMTVFVQKSADDDGIMSPVVVHEPYDCRNTAVHADPVSCR